jgi:hypothetical protein
MIRDFLHGAGPGALDNAHARVLRETDAAAAEARALSTVLRELAKESDPLSVLIRNMRSAQRAPCPLGNGRLSNGRLPPGRN